MKLAKKVYEDAALGTKITAFFREGSSDERALEEVITKKNYARQRVGFDVQPGEHWLDLGANIGSFALYCALRRATADCYEPDARCFDILEVNAQPLDGFKLVNKAVTTTTATSVSFYSSGREGDFYRGTVVAPRRGFTPSVVQNLHVSKLRKRYDGIKLDIEGAEGPLLDSGLLPQTNKLCMEYHTSVDQSVKALKQRLARLRKQFKYVQYPPEFDRIIDSGQEQFKAFFDRMIFAWN